MVQHAASRRSCRRPLRAVARGRMGPASGATAWIAIAVAVAAVPMPAAATYTNPISPCQTETRLALETRGLPLAELHRLEVYADESASSSDDERVVGFDAFAWFTGCEGYVALTMNQVCQVRQVYTTGSCALPAR